MKVEVGKVQAYAQSQYETPQLTVQGSFESLTMQDTDGAHFDSSFNEGDPIPPDGAFAY
jgi:hypothetical protein